MVLADRGGITASGRFQLTWVEGRSVVIQWSSHTVNHTTTTTTSPIHSASAHPSWKPLRDDGLVRDGNAEFDCVTSAAIETPKIWSIPADDTSGFGEVALSVASSAINHSSELETAVKSPSKGRSIRPGVFLRDASNKETRWREQLGILV